MNKLRVYLSVVTLDPLRGSCFKGNLYNSLGYTISVECMLEGSVHGSGCLVEGLHCRQTATHLRLASLPEGQSDVTSLLQHGRSLWFSGRGFDQVDEDLSTEEKTKKQQKTGWLNKYPTLQHYSLFCSSSLTTTCPDCDLSPLSEGGRHVLHTGDQGQVKGYGTTLWGEKMSHD